ncbi:MAG TPA: M42 family metallopeptidase [Symbiobacteriaceae bacterium]|jgi:tetrahedral aminopeptidase|nr:M42 family metallopeptidase [Symbiobacteriaceae bacterium]
MLLERLSNACGISGLEHEVRDLLRQELAPYVDEMWTDAIGNLIVRKGNGPVKVMLDAHTDEVGYCVGSITEDGYLRLKKIGGLDDRVLPGRQVWVTNQRIPAVLGAKAWHLCSADERGKVIPFDQMYADLGCKDRAEVEELGIEPGSPVYFATTFEHFSDKVVKGKAFDDRAGCAVLAEVLMKHNYPGITLYGAFVTQEEVGLRGARIAAYNLNPDVAIALEGTGSANVAGVDPFDTITNMGEGPAISLMDNSAIPNLRVWEELVRVAKANNIKYQHRRIVGGGTDSGGISLQRSGIPVCTVSTPCRYIHTHAALLNLDDLYGAVNLVHHFLLSVEKGDFRP